MVFVHGWGFDESFWTPLKDALAQERSDVESFCVDLGFHGQLCRDIPFEDGSFVGIGHSLGVMWLLRHFKTQPWRALVSINGFARFTKADDFAFGMDPRLLRRMQLGFEKRPTEVYRDFMALCGTETPVPKTLACAPLRDSLEHLMNGDERAALASCKAPVLALAGDADPLVSPDMSAQTFADYKLVMKAGGGHLLPQTDAKWCADQVWAFLKDVSV